MSDIKYEFGVAVFVGSELREVKYQYATYKQAEHDYYHVQAELDERRAKGITVTSVSQVTDTDALAKQLEEIKHSHAMVVRRTVGEWEEANSWEN